MGAASARGGQGHGARYITGPAPFALNCTPGSCRCPTPPPRPAVVPLPVPPLRRLLPRDGPALSRLRLILRSPRLLALSALCAAVTLVSLVVLTWLLWGAPRSLVGWAWPQPTAWYALLAWELVRLLTFVLLLIVGANTVPLLLLTPCRIRSRRSPRSCAATSRPPLPAGPLRAGVGVGLGYTLARVARCCSGWRCCCPAPGARVGSVAFAVLASLWSMNWMAAEHLGGPMARHFYPFRAVRQVLRARRLACLGFRGGRVRHPVGACAQHAVPPLAIVGGTLLFRGLRAAGALPPPQPLK